MLNEQVLEERLAQLEAARTWSPRVVSRLEALLRSEAEEAVFRVNPIEFASEKGITETEAVDLFPHATLAGLVEMELVAGLSAVLGRGRKLSQPKYAAQSFSLHVVPFRLRGRARRLHHGDVHGVAGSAAHPLP
jgi:hypothetical protein